MPDSKAVDKAFQLFQDKEFDKASKAFAKLMKDDSVAPHVKARATQFHQMAVAALEKKDASMDDSIQSLSFFINTRRYQDAEKLLETLELAEDAKLYLLSELEIEQGRRDKALELLRKAVELNEDNAGYALNSPSFASYVKESDFLFLRTEQ